MGSRGGSSGGAVNNSGAGSGSVGTKEYSRTESIAKLRSLFYNAPTNTGVVDRSISNVNERLLSDIVNALDNAVRVFPNTRSALGKLASTPESMKPNTMAWANVRTINLNPTYFQTDSKGSMYKSYEALQAMYANQLDIGYHPAGTKLADAVVHEFGHVVDGLISDTMGSDWSHTASTGWAAKTVRDAVSAYRASNPAKYASMSEKDILKEVSRYSATKRDEAFAEAFSQYASQGSNAHPISVYIGEATVKKLSEQSVADYISMINPNIGITRT